MTMQYPKRFVDTMSIGKPISEEQLKDFIAKATESGIRIGNVKNSKYGGFDTYCGDPEVLFDMLEHLKTNQKTLTDISGSDKITIRYDYIRDGGSVEVDTFACAKGRTITFNKFMYDDSNCLKEQYAEAVSDGRFAIGTSHKNIPDHECGHLLANSNKLYISRLRTVCECRAEELGVSIDEYITSNISIYANHNNELPAEINSMRFGASPQIAVELLKEANLL